MKSLWAYIEAVVDFSLPFTATNSSDLAAWGLGHIWHYNTLGTRLLLLYVLVHPNSSTHVATLFSWSMKSLWAYIEAMVDLSLPFTATNSSDLAAWARFGTLQHSWNAFTPPVC